MTKRPWYYWIRYWWHAVTYAEKWRYQYASGYWSEWCDRNFAYIGDMDDPMIYTGLIQYCPHAEKLRKKNVIREVHRDDADCT